MKPIHNSRIRLFIGAFHSNLIIYRNVFKEYCSKAHLQTHIFTDSFSKEERVRMAIICNETTIQWKLSYNRSIYTAEALEIFKVIEYSISNIDDNNITIFSDSLSTLIKIQHHYNPSEIARKIQNTQITALQSGKNITYTWIPGHCNIFGNDQANKCKHPIFNFIFFFVFYILYFNMSNGH